jgi:hypothetical protein
MRAAAAGHSMGRGTIAAPAASIASQGGSTMADAGPPMILIALGLVLWLAVNATLAGISIQTIGLILTVVGILWLIVELVQTRALTGRRERVVRDEPVVREREMYRP